MRLTLLACLLFLQQFAFSQDSEYQTDLESSVRIYREIRNFSDRISSGSMTKADFRHIDQKTSEGLSLLQPIIAKGNNEEKQIARYFDTNLKYEKAIASEKFGEYEMAINNLMQINAQINGLTSDQFPLEYWFDERLHVIRWEDFAPVQANYNHKLAFYYFDKENLDEALPYARKAHANPYLNLARLCETEFLISSIKLQTGTFDQEAVEMAVDGLDNYSNISEQDRSNRMETVPETSAELLRKSLSTEADLSDEGKVPARAARLFGFEKKEAEYLEFAGMALRDGYENAEFARKTADDAIAAGDNATARLATDKLAELTDNDDCDRLKAIANNYAALNMRAKAEEYSKKVGVCELQSKRKERAANRDGGLYLGTYIVPLFRKNWGAVAAIQTRKVLIEASYLDISNKRDRLRDLQLRSIDDLDEEKIFWDGYYTHLAISTIRSGRMGMRPYTGLLFGYNLREFEELQNVEVFDNTGASIGTFSYAPVEKRYIVMLNGGLHGYGKIFAGDVFIGIGGSYNTFERGGMEADGYAYGSPMLQNRKKGRISLMFRFGITVGLQVGTKTFR